jgi:anaerobic dimethyl sulfoxide reductase subunit A
MTSDVPYSYPERNPLSRRSFISWAAALGGMAALSGGLTGCLQKNGNEDTPPAAGPVIDLDESLGTWQAVPCSYSGCGGYCVNFGLVIDGVVVRQKSDDTHEDSPDFPLRKGCLRGRSQRMQVFGADRLKYPMKRKNWEPGGVNINGDLRGRDEWVRISWDEALDMVASELKRVKENYGNASILDGTTITYAFGGNMQRWGVNSEGNWPLTREKMAGTDPTTNAVLGRALTGSPDRFSFRDAKLVVLWGSNPSWSALGVPTYNYQQAKAAGAKFIIVTPEYNATAVALEADWVPVRPGTDAALLLGIAYYMITNNLQDQDFLDRCCIGFDAEHMPEGEDPAGNFKDYVLGTYDGIPKTPRWASEICGTDVALIESFAQEVATTKPMIFQSSLAPARTSLGHQFTMAFLTVGWMTGNLGIQGGGVCNRMTESFGGMSLIFAGQTGEPVLINPLFECGGLYGGYSFWDPFNTDFVGVAYDETWDAILNNEVTATVRGKIPCDIRMYFSMLREGDHPNQCAGTEKAVKAMRKLECIVSCDIVLSNKSKYADIVLPGTTTWEEFGTCKTTHDPEHILIARGVTDPLFEAKDIPWIETELAKRLDIDPDAIHPFTPKQRFFNICAGTTIFDGQGMAPLVTITQEDIDEWEVEGAPQEGIVPLNEFLSNGGYAVKREPGDIYQMVADMPQQMFRADPVANPAATESGKLEIYCRELARYLTAYGFDECAPIARYDRPKECIEDTYADWENKIKGDYPLQMVSVHYIRRAHSSFDNVPWLRRAHSSEVIMSTIDAEERGLQIGDTILVTSRHGKIIRHVGISDSVMPGVIIIGQGAWFDFDEDTWIDKGGCTNTLAAAGPGGQGMEPFNSCNVQVEKWTGMPLDADYLWPQRVPAVEGV